MKCAEYLVKLGAQVNARNQEGVTPLHKATEQNHKAYIEFLIRNGADVNCSDAEGNRPLHIAVKRGIDQSLLSFSHSRRKFRIVGFTTPKWS